jgi:hypothetical protein
MHIMCVDSDSIDPNPNKVQYKEWHMQAET